MILKKMCKKNSEERKTIEKVLQQLIEILLQADSQKLLKKSCGD